MSIESLKSAITHAAVECESCMRLAQFAEDEPTYTGDDGKRIARGLRRLAAYHSENAFTYAQRLAQFPGGAA